MQTERQSKEAIAAVAAEKETPVAAVENVQGPPASNVETPVQSPEEASQTHLYQSPLLRLLPLR